MSKAKRNKEIICRHLRFDDLKYGQMVMDVGFEWLHFRFNDDEFIIDQASRLGLFWNWWKNQWEIREAEYLRTVPLERVTDELTPWERRCALDLWIHHHNPYKLTIMPNRFLKKEMVAIIDKKFYMEYGIQMI